MTALATTAQNLSRLAKRSAKLASDEAQLKSELSSAAAIYAKWHRIPGSNWYFLREREDGRLEFRSSYAIVIATPAELAEAAKLMQASRYDKRRWSALCREWLLATGVDALRVRYANHDRLGVGVEYWMAGPNGVWSDECGMPWEFFSLRGAEARARFARAHDDDYNTYLCSSCKRRKSALNPDGNEQPRTLVLDCARYSCHSPQTFTQLEED